MGKRNNGENLIARILIVSNSTRIILNPPNSRGLELSVKTGCNVFILSYLGTWETIHNPGFKVVEFDHFRKQADLPSFVLSASEWIERTNVISVPFKLYLIEEFQRLKEQEQAQIGWTAKRELSKINYRIHTDAIKQSLIPQEITPAQASRIYANEADVLNMALFGMTALEWRDKHPDLKGNIRDYASVNELICLSNMESLNAVFIQDGIPQRERLIRLNRIAIQQMQVLEDMTGRKLLK